MKILYCTNSIRYLGGIQRVTVTKANALAEMPGYEVWIAVTDNKAGELTVKLSPKVHLVDLDVNYYADDQISKLHVLKGIVVKRQTHRKRLKKLIDDISPDIIVATGGCEKYFVPSIAGNPKTIREIHFSTGYRMEHARKNGSLFEKVSARVADFIDFRFGVRKYDRLVLLTQEDLDDNWNGFDRAVAIHNPVGFSTKTVSDLTAKELIAVGRLDGQKDFHSLLRIAKMVFDRHPDWHLTILGEGPERQSLEMLANELGISEKVSMPGIVDNVPERLRGASVMCMTSRYEGLPLSLVEAMECGLPCVAYACKCGPKDIFSTPEEGGFLIAPGDEDGFATTVCRLIESEDLRREMGHAAKHRAADFTVGKIMSQWTKLFETLTDK